MLAYHSNMVSKLGMFLKWKELIQEVDPQQLTAKIAGSYQVFQMNNLKPKIRGSLRAADDEFCWCLLGVADG